MWVWCRVGIAVGGVRTGLAGFLVGIRTVVVVADVCDIMLAVVVDPTSRLDPGSNTVELPQLRHVAGQLVRASLPSTHAKSIRDCSKATQLHGT